MRAELKQRQKIRMNLLDFLNIIDCTTIELSRRESGVGGVIKARDEILRKYNLTEADIPRLRKALAKGEYRILARKEEGGDIKCRD